MGHEREARKIWVLVQSFQEREAQQVAKITMRKSGTLDAAVYRQQSRESWADVVRQNGNAARLVRQSLKGQENK